MVDEIEPFNPRSPAQVKKYLAKFGIKLLDTSEETLEINKDKHPLIDKILQLRTLSKLYGTYIKGYSKHITSDNLIHSELSVEGTETGRCFSRNPNLQNVPISARGIFTSRFPGGKLISPDCSALEYRLIGHATQDARLLKIFRDGKDIHKMAAVMLTGLLEEEITDELRRENKTTNYAACLTTGSKVLTSKLDWVDVSNLVAGEDIIAFDEDHNLGHGRKACRRWRTSQIISTQRAMKNCYKVVLDNGDSFTASDDHKLIVKYTNGKKSDWKKIKDLTIGNKIPKYLHTWDKSQNFLDGWLGGFFDGEGNLTSRFNNLTGSQKSGKVFEQVKALVKNLGFKFSLGEDKKSKVQRIHILGGLEKVIHFLGVTKPIRLIENLLKCFSGDKSPIFQAISHPKVKSINFLGLREVVVLETTTKTYIADGYAMHNCYGCGKEQFYARLGRRDEKLFYKAKNLYPGVNAYKERMEAQIMHNGTIVNMFGRIRQFFGDVGYKTFLEAFNWLFQSAGHTVLKCMVIEWFKQIVDNDALDMVKLAQEGHDSCILDVHPSCVADVAQMIKNTDLNALIDQYLNVNMTVPMLIDVKILDRWK